MMENANVTTVRLTVTALEERVMMTLRKPVVAIYVDRASQQWVVLGPDGDLWTIPSTENGWENRQPFQPTEETELEPVPGHYKYLLGLPF